MEPDGFRDRNHRYSYLVACENARRIIVDPELLVLARRHLERFSQRSAGYALWASLLAEPAPLIAARLTERSEAGDYIRETAPAFGSLSNAVRVRLLRQARSPLAEALDGTVLDA